MAGFIEHRTQNQQTASIVKWVSIATSVVLTVLALRAIEQNGGTTAAKLLFVAATLAVIAVNWRVAAKLETRHN